MPQSHAGVYIHWVFSTKGRKPFLNDESVRVELHAVLGGIAKRLECLPIRVGGVADHVHMLTMLSRNLRIADAVKEFKRASNHWIREKCPINGFRWQGGYGAFSVSQSQVESVAEYIANQEEHHRRMTFQDELRGILKRYNIDFDERYVWD